MAPPARRCAAGAWPASPLALWRNAATARSMAAGANDMHGVARDASLSLRHPGRVHRPSLRRQPPCGVPRCERPLRCRHAVASGRVQPERNHLRASAGRPRQHGARPHLHAQVGTALRRPPQRGHRLGAGPRRAGPRRRSAVRGDRRAGRGAGGPERGGRADGHDHRRAAAPVARAGDAGEDGRGTCGDRARRRGGGRASPGAGVGRQPVLHRGGDGRGTDAGRARPRRVPPRGRRTAATGGAAFAAPLCTRRRAHPRPDVRASRRHRRGPGDGQRQRAARRAAAVADGRGGRALRDRAGRGDGPSQPASRDGPPRAPDGIRATVGGGCVPVLRGEAQV